MKIARRSGWDIEPMPVQRSEIKVSRTFSGEEMEQIRRGMVPEQMEDKWFIFWEEGTLYFHRSWTGFCIYELQFEQSGSTWAAESLIANRDKEQYAVTDDVEDALMVSYLIDRILLDKAVAYPRSSNDVDKAVLEQWHTMGRVMLDRNCGQG